VMANWNYAEYIGAALRSIREQDYLLFECIVVDNGSSDGSVDVIKRHIDGDPRFSLVELSENLGQLNAVLHVFDRLKGGFVVFADADDVLLPNFLSSHLQAHLALPSAVGLTSSDVFQVDSDGRVLTSCRERFGDGCKVMQGELTRSSATIRLSTVSEAHFDLLAQRVTRIEPRQKSWVWAPGTANMFRKSVLDLVRPNPDDRTSHAACDNYFVPFVHALAGSALIFQPLSLYRFHDRNVFSAAPPVGILAPTRQAAQPLADQQRNEIVRTLLRRAGEFKNSLSTLRFWETFDLVGRIAQRRSKLFAQPAVRAIILENVRNLDEVFGAREVIAGLWLGMPLRYWWRLVRVAYPGRLTLSLGVYLIAVSLRQFLKRTLPRRVKPR
jgi:glycosyltransferase involved in cell wall biosynthesis